MGRSREVGESVVDGAMDGEYDELLALMGCVGVIVMDGERDGL